MLRISPNSSTEQLITLSLLSEKLVCPCSLYGEQQIGAIFQHIEWVVDGAACD